MIESLAWATGVTLDPRPGADPQLAELFGPDSGVMTLTVCRPAGVWEVALLVDGLVHHALTAGVPFLQAGEGATLREAALHAYQTLLRQTLEHPEVV